MLHKAVKVRLYPTPEQQVLLYKHFGCARWWWNYALNKSIETYKKPEKASVNQHLTPSYPC
jgi:putative transposase